LNDYITYHKTGRDDVNVIRAWHQYYRDRTGNCSRTDEKREDASGESNRVQFNFGAISRDNEIALRNLNPASAQASPLPAEPSAPVSDPLERERRVYSQYKRVESHIFRYAGNQRYECIGIRVAAEKGDHLMLWLNDLELRNEHRKRPKEFSLAIQF
jgi:hypothetical protein